MDRAMPMTDPYAEKSGHFLPREIYFWVLNTLGWYITLSLMNPGADLIQATGDEQFRLAVLSTMWLGYSVLGTLTVLGFRHFYYRQRWYLKKFIGSAPLALVAALAGGFAIALLVDMPMRIFMGGDFRVYNEAGALVLGPGSFLVFACFEVAPLLLVWLLVYLGIEGAVNARSLVIKALVLENSLKDARLNALAGQINPHFLFNALNNIRFMIQRDAVRAEAGLLDLSEILRHSLNASTQDKVTLARELFIAERYLSLMQMQMQRRLEYGIQAEEVPEHVLVPPMMIQMLAENAIKHGLENSKEGGRIDIHCTISAGSAGGLCIEVKNTAASGVSVTQSDEKPVTLTDLGGNGLGLANISKRLSLLYGDKARLSMFRQAHGFLVRIALPCEEDA